MEKEIIYITSKADLKEVFLEMIRERDKIALSTSFEKERINRSQAEKVADISSPTFRKMVLSGIFPEHGFNRKKFYLKSEILFALRNKANQKIR